MLQSSPSKLNPGYNEPAFRVTSGPNLRTRLTFSLSKSEPRSLFLPVNRRSFPKLLHCETYRLLTIQDRIYDVGRQECRMENLRNIPFVESSCFPDRAAPGHSTGDDLFIPVMSSCNCFD